MRKIWAMYSYVKGEEDGNDYVYTVVYYAGRKLIDVVKTREEKCYKTFKNKL